MNEAEDGRGKALKIDFSTSLPNGNFEEPEVDGEISGWEINRNSVVLDETEDWYQTEDQRTLSRTGNFNSSLEGGALRLWFTGNITEWIR